MKRTLALLLSILMLATFTAAYATEGGEKVDTGITLTFMASVDWIYPAEMELAKQFEELRGTKIDYQIVPGDQYYNLLLTKLNAGECTDIFGTQSGRFDIVSQLDIQKNGVDLTGESWVDRYDEFSAQEMSVDGKLYGYTYFDTTTDFYVLYNKTIFTELGLEVPTSYAEFSAVCDAILANSDKVPFFECAGSVWHHVMWFTEIGPRYEQLVPGLTDALNNNETTFAENEFFVECITQVNEMAQKGYFGDNYLSEEYSDLVDSMGSGNYVMTMAKPGDIESILTAYPDWTEEDFGLFYIPTLDNQTLNLHPCGPSRVIYSGSPNVEEAKLYFEFLASPESLQYMIDNEPKIENLPFNDLEPAYSDTTRAFVEGAEHRGVVWQDCIKYLNPQFWEIGTDMIAVFTDTMTPEQVIENIDKRRTEQAVANNDPAWQ